MTPRGKALRGFNPKHPKASSLCMKPPSSPRKFRWRSPRLKKPESAPPRAGQSRRLAQTAGGCGSHRCHDAAIRCEMDISVPKDAWLKREDVFLQIHYQGDVGVCSRQDLLDDNFCNGDPMDSWIQTLCWRLDAPFRLEVLPLRDDAPIYFDAGYRPQFKGKQLAGLPSITAVAEYEIVMRRRSHSIPSQSRRTHIP